MDINIIDRRHLLVKFGMESDFLKIYTREKWVMRGQVLKVFRWTPWFWPGTENNIAPVWIALPSLPQCYYKAGFIKSVAKVYGPLLCIASATSSQSTAV